MTAELQTHEITPIPDTAQDFTGERETGDSLDAVSYYESRIRSQFSTCASSMIEFALLCADAKATLSVEERKQLLERLNFQEANFSKWAKNWD